MKKLTDLKLGEVAIIDSFASEDIYIKLLEMGCIPGEKIIVEQIAPLGDPISVYVSGYRLSLRLSEADQIYVSAHSLIS